MRTRLELAEAMSVDDYRAALAKREAMRSRFRAVAAAGASMITLSSAGPAPFMEAHSAQGAHGLTHPPGPPAFNPSPSDIASPAVTGPTTALRRLPRGAPVLTH